MCKCNLLVIPVVVKQSERGKDNMRKNVTKKTLGVVMTSAMVATSFGNIPGLEWNISNIAKAASNALYVDDINYYNKAYDEANAYAGNDLGANYTKEQTVFKVWSPEADTMTLNLYTKGSDEEEGSKKIGSYKMTKGDKGVWEYTCKGDMVNTYYTYTAMFAGIKSKEAVDPYAKAAGANGTRGMVVDLNSTDPEGWDNAYKREKTNLSDIVVWEVHVRDFSIDVSSGVSEKNRGKYKAFTESTTVNGEGKIASCVDYLKKSGVTHVQILPMYDYGGVDETKAGNSISEDNYNWGYNPENYNVPEGSYSSDPYNGNTRITEMKEMIQALHDAGIKVIMDVVYNHTYSTEDSSFTKLMPDYYYKLKKSGKKVIYNDESGCGNATRSGAKMYEKFMTDSLKYWASEYNLDGFRFDLMGIHDAATMNHIRKELDATFGEDTIVMYGEGWTGGGFEETSAYKTYARNLDDGIGYFNDQIRDAIKGETSKEKAKQIGFVQQNYGIKDTYTDHEKFPTSVFGGAMGSVGKNTSEWWMWRAYWADTSARVLSYDSCHDNQTLWDKLIDSTEGGNYNTLDDKYVEMNRLAAGYLLTSHGGTFLHAGEEFARSKGGVENSYNAGDLVNRLDWTRVDSYKDLVSYYHGMIKVRKAFSGFRNTYTETGDVVEENTETGFFNNVKGNNLTEIKEFTNVTPGKDAEGRIQSTVNSIGYYLSNDKTGEWNQVAVLMNNTLEDKTVDLTATDGSEQWVIVSDGRKADVKGVATTEGKKVTVPRKSLVVAVPKKTFDANPVNVATTTAPNIVGVKDLEVEKGTKVEFTVVGKDSDEGDVVTLSATNLPEGATFDEKTGVFSWASATAGNHVVKFTATDSTGKKKTVSMKLRVTSSTLLLQEKVEAISGAALVESEYTKESWNNLQTLLTEANALIADANTTDVKADECYLKVSVAYQVIKKEKRSRVQLANCVKTATDKINASLTPDFEAELVEDAKVVKADAEKLLETVGSYEAYDAAKANLEDACSVLVSTLPNPSIYVKTDVEKPNIYAWNDNGNLAGDWPGTPLTEKNEQGYYVFELPVNEPYNAIINGAGGQTVDIKDLAENTYLTIGAEFSVDEQKQEALTGDKKVIPVTKKSLENAIALAKTKTSEEYAAEGLATLSAEVVSAEAIVANDKATQLSVNKEARALRTAMVSLVRVKPEALETPTPAPTAPALPTATPQATNAPADTQAPAPTGATSATPVASLAPTMDPNMPLEIKTFSVTPAKYQVVNKAIKAEVKTVGGKGSNMYRFYVFDSKGILIASSNNKTATSFSYKPAKADTYTVKVTVKDVKGNVVEKTAKAVVISKKVTVSSLKANKKTVKKGETMKFTAKVVGGKSAFTYKFEIKDSKNKTVKNSSEQKKNTWSWKATKTGTFKVTVTVKDALGMKATKSIAKVTVKK